MDSQSTDVTPENALERFLEGMEVSWTKRKMRKFARKNASALQLLPLPQQSLPHSQLGASVRDLEYIWCVFRRDAVITERIDFMRTVTRCAPSTRSDVILFLGRAMAYDVMSLGFTAVRDPDVLCKTREILLFLAVACSSTPTQERKGEDVETETLLLGHGMHAVNATQKIPWESPPSRDARFMQYLVQGLQSADRIAQFTAVTVVFACDFDSLDTIDALEADHPGMFQGALRPALETIAAPEFLRQHATTNVLDVLLRRLVATMRHFLRRAADRTVALDFRLVDIAVEILLWAAPVCDPLHPRFRDFRDLGLRGYDVTPFAIQLLRHASQDILPVCSPRFLHPAAFGISGANPPFSSPTAISMVYANVFNDPRWTTVFVRRHGKDLARSLAFLCSNLHNKRDRSGLLTFSMGMAVETHGILPPNVPIHLHGPPPSLLDIFTLVPSHPLCLALFIQGLSKILCVLERERKGQIRSLDALIGPDRKGLGLLRVAAAPEFPLAVSPIASAAHEHDHVAVVSVFFHMDRFLRQALHIGGLRLRAIDRELTDVPTGLGLHDLSKRNTKLKDEKQEIRKDLAQVRRHWAMIRSTDLLLNLLNPEPLVSQLNQ